jgi:hypothetical protein
MHDNEEVCLENLYDNALDDGPMLLDVINYNATENMIAIMCPIPFKSDQSSCFAITKSEKEEVSIFNFDPTILELDMDCVLADHEKHALCDIYIVEFVYDATENYYERGKCGCWNFHVTKTPLFILKVPKLLFFYLPMLVTICASLIYFLTRFLCIGSGLDLNVFHICSLMLSFASIHIFYVSIFSNY